MHTPTSPLGTSSDFSVELSNELLHGNTLGERVTVPSVRAEDGILLTQVCAHARGDRLLTYVSVAGPGDLPGRVGARQLLLGPPNRKHRTVERKHLLFTQVINRFSQEGVSNLTVSVC